jgi:hypothetical protein
MGNTVFSREFPPKNRPDSSSLGVLDIEITSQSGVTVLDPNTAAMTAAEGTLPFGAPLPDLPSTLSGRPAYRFRTDEVEMALAPDELLRLWQRNLHPGEYVKLREAFGIFFEIHDDFYVEETGEAVQPM